MPPERVCIGSDDRRAFVGASCVRYRAVAVENGSGGQIRAAQASRIEPVNGYVSGGEQKSIPGNHTLAYAHVDH